MIFGTSIGLVQKRSIDKVVSWATLQPPRRSNETLLPNPTASQKGLAKPHFRSPVFAKSLIAEARKA
jgi:hypothetical protein